VTTAPAPSSSPRATAEAVPHTASAVVARPDPLRQWSGLATIYLIWGSTYLAIRVMVETMPALLGAGVRFVVAGVAMLAVLAARRGWAAVRLRRPQLYGALLIGALLPGANAIVTVAEQEVPSGLAALLIAAVPLWVVLWRLLARERVPRTTLAAVLVGFAGVALLLRPGEQSGDATMLGLLACVGAAATWSLGAFSSSRVPLPADPLVSTGWQLLLGGTMCSLAGLAAGDGADVDLGAFSTRSLVAFAYLVVFGSVVAYTAFAWLLQNVPVSKVATYAFVNPMVAIALGWLVLDEVVAPVTLIAAAVIVVSVALVVRSESH
jgi:drug/metabolite transporter (DMT)-like permease